MMREQVARGPCARWFRRAIGLTALLLAAFAAHAQSSSVLQANSIVSGGETRPASSSLQPASAITIEAWVTAPTAATNYPAFVSYGLDSASPYESYILQAQDIDGNHPADFYFLTGAGTHHQLFGVTHLAVGTRYLLSATYDGTTAKLYVNGALDSSVAVSGSLYYPGGTGLGLGRKYSTTGNNFSGTEQGVAIYNAALTAAQISAHYAAGPPSPVFTLSQVASGGVTQAGSSTLQPSSAITIATWINSPATLTNYPALVSYGLDTSPYESYILQAQQISGSYPMDFFFLTGTGTSHRLYGTTNLATGTQYFLVATYDGSTASLYLNGALQSTLAVTGALYYPGGGLGLARKYSTTTNNFTGTERGVAIYGAALPADRIAAQYQAGSPPTIPTSLTTTAASSTQINLAWTASSDVAGVAGYLIERCTGASCSGFAQIGNSASGSFSDTGLSAATAYTYRIRAVNVNNNVSDYTAAVGATTSSGGGGGDTTPPTAPTNVVATANSSSQITVTWTASTDNVGVTGYRVERCQGSGCSTFTQVGTPTASPYVDTGLAASTMYVYRVRATDAAGNLSAYSSTASATTTSGADTQPPTAPSGLSANAASGSQINLSWTASTDNVGVAAYHIERCQGSGCSNFSEITSTSTTSYSDTGLAGSTSYSYRVRAADAAGNYSGYSNTASATTQTVVDTQPPTSPTNLAVTGGSGTTINLGWTASTDNVGVTAYLLERCQGVNCTSFVQIATPSTPSYADSGVAASTPYSYRVKARDAANNQSGYSNVLSLVTPPSGGVCTP